MNTEAPTFLVDRNELIFTKERSSVQSFSTAKNHGFLLQLRVTHNLPRCFKIIPDSVVLDVPCMVQVAFDHDVKMDNGEFSEQMHIELDDKWSSPCSIKVKFSDAIEASTSKKSEALECKVCLLQFSDDDEELIPRMLPACGHTLCQKCVQQLTTPSGQVPCPFDRKFSQIHKGDGLPKNYTIIELIEEKKASELITTNMATLLSDDPDVPCYENPKHEASRYCTSCDADLCESCFVSTHSARIFASHTSIAVEEKPVKLPNCVLHSANVALYVCKDTSCQLESKFFCDECRLEEHKSHEHGNLEEHITENQRDLYELIKKLKSSHIKFQIKLDATEKCAQTFDKTTPAYANKVESVKKYFDAMKKEALNRLEAYVDTEKNRLDGEIDELKNDMKLMEDSRKEMEKTLKQRKNLYNVKEILGKAEALTSLEGGGTEELVPFSVISIPDDVKVENIRKIVFNDPNLVNENVGNRPIAKATRKQKATITPTICK